MLVLQDDLQRADRRANAAVAQEHPLRQSARTFAVEPFRTDEVIRQQRMHGSRIARLDRGLQSGHGVAQGLLWRRACAAGKHQQQRCDQQRNGFAMQS